MLINGISMPRSGHHFLVELLKAALGEALHYCEFYTQADCCGQRPCARAAPGKLTLTKNHDFDLSFPTGHPDGRYLVQYRSPVPEALSDRELFSSVWGEALLNDPWALEAWLARKAAYLKGFCRRWLTPGATGRHLLPYESLEADPERALADLLSFGQVEAPAGALSRAVAAVASARVAPPLAGVPQPKPSSETFAPRQVRQEDLPLPDHFARFESHLMESFAPVSVPRHLPEQPSSGTAFEALVTIEEAVLRQDPEKARQLAEEASGRWPDHPYVWLALGKAEQARGEEPQAAAALSRYLALAQADDPDGLQATLVALLRAQRHDESLEASRRLAGSFPSIALHHLLRAQALHNAGYSSEAGAAAQAALDRGLQLQEREDLARLILEHSKQGQDIS